MTCGERDIQFSSLKGGQTPYEMIDELREEMVDVLYREARIGMLGMVPRGDMDDTVLFTEEVNMAVRRLKVVKVQGYYGI